MNISEDHQRPAVAGHRIDDVIGQGATSVVWSGTDAMGRAVAIKVPRQRPDAVALAQGEIERHVLTAVRHDHLVPLRDVVPLQDGRIALVFDRVRGASLRATVDMRGSLRPGEAVTVVSPLSQAVAALHRAGGTHGDLSPDNALLTADGRPLLTDLGAARLAGEGSGAVHGTPGFAAPEVRRGEAPGEAADVFGLGALAWFCLTGNGAPDTMIRLDPETVESHVGPELAAVVGACIDPDPTRRPSAAEVGPMFFAAATPEPVEVVVGADEATALTNRLRLEAAQDAVGPQQEPTVRSSSGRRALRGLGERLRRLWGRRATAALALVLASVVTSLAAWFLVPWPDAGATSRAAEVHDEGTPGGMSTPTADDWSRDLTRNPSSATRFPAVLLQVLADRRAAALTARDLDALARVHRPGSPAEQQDREMVERLRADGHRYDGLHLVVADASVVPVSAAGPSAAGPTAPPATSPTATSLPPPGDSARAVIRARVDVGPYAVVDREETRVEHLRHDGAVLHFHLVATDAGWRIESISAPAAT